MDGRSPMATLRIRPGLRKSAPNPHRSRSPTLRFGARWRERRSTIQLLLEQEILSDDGSHAGSAELRGCDGQVKQGEQEILHARNSVGQNSGATQWCLRPRFSDRIRNSRPTGPRRERVLPVHVDSRRSTSKSDSRSASCRIGACVQRAQSNDRAWSTRVVRDRSVMNLRVGALGASFDLRNNALLHGRGLDSTRPDSVHRARVDQTGHDVPPILSNTQV